MTFTQARDLFAVYLGAQEVTIDPIISTTDRDALLNEAYLEIEATYSGTVLNSAGAIANSAATLVVGASLGAFNVFQLESCEMSLGVAQATPLIRGSFGSMLRLHSTEGAVGRPRQWGASLVSKNQLTGVVTFKSSFYPAPDQSYNFYFFFKKIADELVNGTDVYQLDDVQADYSIRLAVYRAGYTLGYDDLYLQDLVSPLPDAYQNMLAVDHRTRYAAPKGLARKAGEDREDAVR